MKQYHAPTRASSRPAAENSPNPAFLLLEVQFQPDAQTDLHDEHKDQTICETSVNVRMAELSPAVHMTQKVCHCSNHCADDLTWDVPSTLDYSEHHAVGEDHPEGQYHEEDVHP